MKIYSLKRKSLPRVLLFLTLILIGTSQFYAKDFTYHGLKYTTLTDNTCETKQGLSYLVVTNAVRGNIVIPETVYDEDGNAYIVTKIGNCSFANSINSTSVSIPNSVTSIGETAFYGCTGLSTVTIPGSVTSIGEEAFRECDGLIKCAYPSNLSNPFIYGYCTSIAFPKDAKIEDGIIWDADKSKLYFVPISYEGELTISDSVTEIDPDAFYSCSNLTSVTIGNSVTSIEKNLFDGCTNLSSVTIGNSVTTIGECAFQGCSSLKSIELPPYLSTLERRTFRGCSSLETVYIGKSLNYIDSEDVFYGCLSLQNFIVDEDNYYYASNSTGAIYSKDFSAILLCPPGKNAFDIPETVTAIGKNSFYGCSKLTSVSIPNSVTSIEKFAFDECSALVHLVIPSSVTAIADYAFYGCTGLKSVTCVWDEPLPVITDKWVFSSTTYENCPLYVPIGTKDKYANTATWCKFENIYERNINGVEDIDNDSNANISIEHGSIYIESDTDVRIVSMSGTTIYSGRGATRLNVAPGVYIVITGTTISKVVVK